MIENPQNNPSDIDNELASGANLMADSEYIIVRNTRDVSAAVKADLNREDLGYSQALEDLRKNTRNLPKSEWKSGHL